MLMIKSLPALCFKNTASGGKRMAIKMSTSLFIGITSKSKKVNVYYSKDAIKLGATSHGVKLMSDYSSTTKATRRRTKGETATTAGKAITKAKAQAFSQIERMLCTKPTLNKLMTKDIKHDISSAMKNEKT